MKIDVIDMTDGELANSVLNFIVPYTDHIFQMYPQSNGFLQMCVDVATFVAASGQIDVMRIWGHGSDGSQNISAGNVRSAGVSNESSLYYLQDVDGNTITNIDQDHFAPALRALGDFFAADGHLELKGCNVASSSNGQKLIADIARCLGRNVQASMVTQSANAVASNGYGWTGTVMEVKPDGSPPSFSPGSHL